MQVIIRKDMPHLHIRHAVNAVPSSVASKDIELPFCFCGAAEEEDEREIVYRMVQVIGTLMAQFCVLLPYRDRQNRRLGISFLKTAVTTIIIV